MRKTRFAFSIAAVAFLVATPAMGQLANFPILVLPAGDADGSTTIGVGWGRGLSDTSGKLNAYGGGISRAMESVSFGIYSTYIADVTPLATSTGELAFGGRLAYNLPVGENDSPLNWGLQGGIEYRKDDGAAGADDMTLWNFPIGISAQGSTTAGSLEIPLWIMPRWQWTRSSDGTTSTTENGFGASTGISGVSEGGFGLGVSLDWTRPTNSTTNSKENLWLFGAAVFYRL